MFIYAIQFDNGLVKIGRTVNVSERIMQHAHRLIVGNINMVSSKSFKCIGDVELTEKIVLRHCRSKATKTLKSEWFYGLNFDEICTIAENECSINHIKPKACKVKLAPVSDHAILINKCGGVAALSKFLSEKEVLAGRKPIGRNTIQAWIKRGIPAKIELRYEQYFKKMQRK